MLREMRKETKFRDNRAKKKENEMYQIMIEDIVLQTPVTLKPELKMSDARYWAKRIEKLSTSDDVYIVRRLDNWLTANLPATNYQDTRPGSQYGL